nr:hypothetical protein [Tanacetum cinerariifolium]
KELASPKQTALGKDNSNPLIVDSLLKNIWLSMHHVIAMKHWLFQGKRQLYRFDEKDGIRFTAGALKLLLLCILLLLFSLTIDAAVNLVLLECLSNEDILAELAHMGYEKPHPKLTFYKAFFSAQWKFLIHTLVQCVSAKRTAWNEFSCSMASAVICLATVLINNQVDDLSSHTIKYTSLTLTQKVFANMRRIGKGFFGIETPLFATMMIQPHVVEEEEDEDDEVPFAPTPPSPIHPPSPSPQEPITTPPQAQPAPSSSPLQEQPADTSESSMTLLNTLTETCATLSQQVAHLEQGKIAQALEILKLKRRVKKLEKNRRLKSSGLKRLRKVVGRIEAIDADEEIILVDMETQANLGAELQGRKDDDNAADKEVNAAEPTVFNDEEVTMTMAQTLIKMKAKKSRLLDGQMAKRLHDEEIKQAVAKEKQEKDDLEKAKVLQKQYVDKQENLDWNVVVEQIQEKHLDNIRKYQSLKRKPISIAQARKNMIIYLKNMAGYKMEYFKGMTYDKVRPIFEREYNKVQTFFNPDKDEEPIKKRVAEETLLQESFKKLKAVKVSCSYSTQDTSTNDPKEMSEEDVKNMLEIVPVTKFKVEALQVKEDLDALWRLVKDKFNSAVPTADKEKALWIELKRLFEPDANDVIWKLQRYMNYPIL